MTSTGLARIALLFVSVLSITVASPKASAQVGTGAIDGGSSSAVPALSADDFTLVIERYDVAQSAWVALTPAEQAHFFGRARCECAADTSAFAGMIKIAIVPSPAASSKIQALLAANGLGSGSARLYAGSNVLNCLAPGAALPGAFSSYCVNLLDPSDVTAGIPGGMATLASLRLWESPPIPVARLFGAAQVPVCNSPQTCDQTSTCASTLAAANIYFWAQTSAGYAPDRDDLSLSVNLVGQTSFAPRTVTVNAANEALDVAWDWSGGVSPAGFEAFLGLQLFCQRGEGAQVFAPGTYTPAFTSAAALCPAVAPPPSSPLAFANLSPAYLCSGLLPSSATSYHIAGLQNDVFYGVGVAAVDRYGNVSLLAPTDLVYQAPSASAPSDGGPDGGSHSGGGGGCALAGGGGTGGAGAALSLLALGMALLGRRRPRR
jgi:hypothetical protein